MILINSETEVVLQFLRAIERGDEADIDALQAPECSWWILGHGVMSREEYTASVRAMLLTASSRRVDVLGITAEGDRVAVEIRSEMLFGDRVYRNSYHDLFVVRDGRIVEGREYFDTAAVAAFQLDGTLPKSSAQPG